MAFATPASQDLFEADYFSALNKCNKSTTAKTQKAKSKIVGLGYAYCKTVHQYLAFCDLTNPGKPDSPTSLSSASATNKEGKSVTPSGLAQSRKPYRKWTRVSPTWVSSILENFPDMHSSILSTRVSPNISTTKMAHPLRWNSPRKHRHRPLLHLCSLPPPR